MKMVMSIDWCARELQKVLEYKDWRNFRKVIDKAITSAENSNSVDNDWVVKFNVPIKTGKRNLTKKGNYSLNVATKNAGVKNFDKFHNAGYKGLYNGETASDIAKRKKLRYREDILDNMGSEELAANLFRITQTESKLKKENKKMIDQIYKIKD